MTNMAIENIGFTKFILQPTMVFKLKQNIDSLFSANYSTLPSSFLRATESCKPSLKRKRIFKEKSIANESLHVTISDDVIYVRTSHRRHILSFVKHNLVKNSTEEVSLNET